MPGDRGLAFVIIGVICTIGLWIGSARTVEHPAKAALASYAPAAIGVAPLTRLKPAAEQAKMPGSESKARLADELGLTPLD